MSILGLFWAFLTYPSPHSPDLNFESPNVAAQIRVPQLKGTLISPWPQYHFGTERCTWLTFRLVFNETKNINTTVRRGTEDVRDPGVREKSAVGGPQTSFGGPSTVREILRYRDQRGFVAHHMTPPGPALLQVQVAATQCYSAETFCGDTPVIDEASPAIFWTARDRAPYFTFSGSCKLGTSLPLSGTMLNSDPSSHRPSPTLNGTTNPAEAKYEHFRPLLGISYLPQPSFSRFEF